MTCWLCSEQARPRLRQKVKRQKVREIAMAWVCGERGHGHTMSSVGLACGDRHGMGVRPHIEVCISVCAHACAGEPAGIENMHACEFKA
jgi:hypothetical protein